MSATQVVGAVTLRVAAATDVGRRRHHNEDSILAVAPVFLVADGMGGYEAGDRASAAVVDAFSHVFASRPLADLEALVALRCALLLEMGAVAEDGVPALAEATRRYLRDALPVGAFHSWVACDEAGAIVACSGFVFAQKPPSPGNLDGREAYVMNMYTLPAWRGRGLAAALLDAALAFAREQEAGTVRLHATPQGRAIYERAGFVAVDNEMVARV